MRKLYLILLISISIFAQTNEDDFLKTLNEVSEIATKTKLNIDKTPSNVTVINRDFIIKSGAKTLLDILQYVPGISISISASGKKQIIIRGNKSTYRDKIKFLINGVSVTNNLYSNQFYYYNFPASLIKRIEITKTPSSVIYGEHAFLGVINIITLDDLDENQFSFYQSSKRETVLTAFNKFGNFLIDGHYEISNLNIRKVKSYLIDIPNTSYSLFRTQKPNTYEKNTGIGIRYKKENSTLSYRIEYYKKGNFFGIVNVPPLKHDKGVNFIYQYLQYDYNKFITDNLKNCFITGIKNYIWDGEFRVFPYDFNESVPHNNPNKDIIEGAKIHEYELYVKNLLTFSNEKHIANFVIEGKFAKPYDYYYLQYIPELNNKRKLTGNNNVLKEDIKRKVFSIGAQDLYIINENFSIVYGGRFYHYNDFGNNFSYKIGSVYNVNKKTTFKLLYNTAFRAPSWVELYAQSAASFNGNPDLKAEKIKMTEFIWLQKFLENDKFKFTYYTGSINNYIGREYSLNTGKKIYHNLGKMSVRGFEANYKKIFIKGYVNVSYSYNANKAKFSKYIHNINTYEYLGIRKNWYKGYGVYKINKQVNIFNGIIYGTKIKTPYYVKNIPSYFSWNINLNYHKKNSEIIIGIDNLTNHANYELDYPSDFIYGRYFFVLQKARIPKIGRRFYLSLVKKW